MQRLYPDTGLPFASRSKMLFSAPKSAAPKEITPYSKKRQATEAVEKSARCATCPADSASFCFFCHRTCWPVLLFEKVKKPAIVPEAFSEKSGPVIFVIIMSKKLFF